MLRGKYHSPPEKRAPASQRLQKRLRTLQLREQIFFCIELARMDAPTTSAQLHRMLQVQHLVIDQVFNGESRHVGTIKYPADNDGIMRRIVVPKTPTR